jgi:hypothetical protein
MNLDHTRYERRFDRTFRDSGAILVGARASAGHYPSCSTNRGNRIDMHGAGAEVWTTGYGVVRVPDAEGDPRQWYTSQFSGTSSASAIVAGAVTCLVGIQKSNLTRGAALQGVHRMNPAEVRTLLRETGTPQIGTELGLIGSEPNLRSAFQHWSRGLIMEPGGTGGIVVVP